MHSPGVRERLQVVRSAVIGRLKIEVALSEPVLTCSRARLMAINDLSYLLVVPLRAPLTFEQDGRSGVVDVGGYLLLSQGKFYELRSLAGCELLFIRLPLSDLQGRIISADDHVGGRFRPHKGMQRLMVNMLDGLSDEFSECPPPHPEALATEVLDLIGLTINSEDRGTVTDVRNSRYKLRRRIVDFIEANLADPGLTPTKIANAERISMSYLYELLTDDNVTVTQMIRTKRLQRAYEMLVTDVRRTRTIAEVAYEVGFKNVSHFSRSFSSHFGIPPRAAHGPALITDPIAPLPPNKPKDFIGNPYSIN